MLTWALDMVTIDRFQKNICANYCCQCNARYIGQTRLGIISYQFNTLLLAKVNIEFNQVFRVIVPIKHNASLVRVWAYLANSLGASQTANFPNNICFNTLIRPGIALSRGSKLIVTLRLRTRKRPAALCLVLYQGRSRTRKA